MGAGATNLHRRADADPIEPVSSCHADAMTKVAYENGSAMLRDRIRTMFERFEETHRLPPGLGAMLLLDTGMTVRTR